MHFREITKKDIPAILAAPTASNKNNFTYKKLGAHELTFELLEEKLQTSYKGWLCEMEGEIVGLIMADKKTGEIGVLAVLHKFRKKGVGTQLLHLAEHWLISSGRNKFWLTSSPDTKLRADSFYLKNGWTECKEENGLLYRQKTVTVFA